MHLLRAHASPDEAANDNTRTRVPLIYLSAGCPEGWGTVLGYLATTNPALIYLMDQVPDAIDRDEELLDGECGVVGIVPVMVPACLWRQRQGITQCKAYPLDLLAQRLG